MILIFKKYKLNEKYFLPAIYLFGVLAAAILFEKILDNLGDITINTGILISALKHLGAPFFVGFAIAYLIHPLVNTFEKLFKQYFPMFQKHSSLRRTLSIFLTYAVGFGGITWILVYFIPEIITSLSIFYKQLPKHLVNLETTIQHIFDQVTFINAQDVNSLIDTIIRPMLSYTRNVPLMLQTIMDSTVIAASSLLNGTMGIFIAFYMLVDKERFLHSARKTIYALFDEKKANHFFYNTNRIHTIFQNFIIGKTVDSTLIGMICFAGLSIIHSPYATVISFIIGLTNMIPYFGPFIGAIPALLIVVLTAPGKVIWVALFILALQQFDGIILGPKILGNSTGMSPLLIIFSIIVGGALMGPLGMFLGVPVFASIKMFWGEFIHKKYNSKYFYEDPPAPPKPPKTKPKLFSSNTDKEI